MRLKNMTLAGIILLMFAFVISPVNAGTDNTTIDSTNIDTTSSDAGGDEEELVDDIEPDESMISPDSVLYNLELALDDLDVTFTFNETEKIQKQVLKAQKRLAEIKAALEKQNSRAAEIAIEQYREDNEKASESVSKLKIKDERLIRTQAMIAKHEYVLEGLIESHPNNTGLIRAHNNSEILIGKFASKTKVKFERKTDKMGRKTLKHVEIEDDEEDGYEKTSIKASVEENKTRVKVELKFLTNNTEPADIAGEISDRLTAIENNVSGLIKIERDSDENDDKDDDEDEPEVTVTGGPTTTLTKTKAVTRPANLSSEKLKAEAEVKEDATRVKFEYTFFLGVSEDSAIINGVEEKLSTLTDDKILNALDVKVKEKRGDTEEKKQDEKNKVETDEGEQENKSIRNREGIRESEDKD